MLASTASEDKGKQADAFIKVNRSITISKIIMTSGDPWQ